MLDEKPERLPPQAWLVEHARDSGAHVSQIRRTLGKQADGSSFIKTLRSQGYVFVADVEAGR